MSQFPAEHQSLPPESPAAFVSQYAPLPLHHPKPMAGHPAADSLVDAWTHSHSLSERGRQHALAAVEIWFGELEQAHQRVQYASDPDGMYWHSILHRLEGDFDNAIYWARRVGTHPAQDRVASLLDPQTRQDSELQRLFDRGQWQTVRWIEACRRTSLPGKKDAISSAKLIALGVAEWRALVEHVLQGPPSQTG